MQKYLGQEKVSNTKKYYFVYFIDHNYTVFVLTVASKAAAMWVEFEG